MSSRHLRFFVMVWLLLGLLAACGMVEETGTAPDETAASQPAGVPPPTDDLLTLRANTWEWIGLDEGGGVREVENPANYRATFNNDATLAIAADCNNAAGSYQVNEINGNALTIEIDPVTAAACPEGSRSDEFIGLLAAAAGGLRFEDGNLLIEVAQEAGLGTMIFAPVDEAANQSAAVPPPTEDLLALRANAWEWVGLDNGDGMAAVENSANYRVMFNSDASLAVAADCNNAAGSYQVNEINGNTLTIEIGPVTAAACPEGSRSGEFIAMLPSAQSLSFDDGKLRIVVSGETGPVTMVFTPSNQGVELPQSGLGAGTTDLAIMPDEYQYVVPFDLGDAVLVQTGQTDERNREMPVRLNGLIAAPPEGDNLPLAIIIHGSHGSGCNSPNGLTEDWPCPAQEKAHYKGFAYLIEALAERGYIAMSINANPAFVSAYGDIPATVRLPILFDLYLEKIAAAARGEDIGLPVNLTGRVDLSQLVVLGHSAGGEGTTWIVDTRAGHNTPEEISAGHGRIAAAILLAPTFYATQQVALALPFAVILPACDRDVTGLDGQNYYEDAREQVERETLAASIFLRGANHNRFNSQLEDETLGRGSSACENALLPVEDHELFLKRYVVDFFDAVLPGNSNADTGAIGLDATAPAPDTVLGYPVLTSLALPANQRLILPVDGSGITGPATAVACQRGYSQAEEIREVCKHGILIQPGHPRQLAISWEGTDAVYETGLADGDGNVSAYEMVHLRVSIDPTNPLNPADEPQVFAIRLKDGSGASAVVDLAQEPALAFPAGRTWSDGVTTFWDTPVVLSSIRVPLSAFEGVDLTDLRSVALVFGATPSGAIFVTDLEFLKKDEDDMTQSTATTSDIGKPAYVTDLEATYGPPSQEGFGSAVFYEQLATDTDLEDAAKKYYQHFVGDRWEKRGEATWLGPWQHVYARDPGATRDIVAELRGIADPKAHVSVPMILDELENADEARQALAAAFNAPEVSDLRVYTIGDGEQMSGLILAGRRSNGEATFLLFLLD